MRCPYCGSLETQVKDSRPTEDASSIRRRRVCPDCGGRFTTFERVQLRELVAQARRERILRERQCEYCGDPIPPERVGRGKWKARYCKPTHRQYAYYRRKRAMLA